MHMLEYSIYHLTHPFNMFWDKKRLVGGGVVVIAKRIP